MINGPAGRGKSGGAIIKAFKNNMYRGKKRSEGDGIGIGTEKRPSS